MVALGRRLFRGSVTVALAVVHCVGCGSIDDARLGDASSEDADASERADTTHADGAGLPLADAVVADGSERPFAEPLQWSTMSLGRDIGCGLTTDGRVYCWGKNQSLTMWNGAPESTRPRRISLPSPATQMHVYHSTVCALLIDHSVYCWGNNVYGQLGRGSVNEETQIAQRDGLGPDRAIATGVTRLSDSGHFTICALSADGAAACWGRGWQGALGVPTDSLVCGERRGCSGRPQDLALRDVTSIVGTGESLCATVATGQVWCWGRDSQGVLGTGILRQNCTEELCATPRPVRALQDNAERLFSPDSDSMCALLRDGRLSCWGAGLNPKVDMAGRATPTVVELPGRVIGVGATGVSACVRLADETWWCWSYALNESGGRRYPVAAGPLMREPSFDRFVHLGGNGSAWYGIERDGSAWIWGRVGLTVAVEPTGARGWIVDPTPLARAVD